jgi:hypothetical protein
VRSLTLALAAGFELVSTPAFANGSLDTLASEMAHLGPVVGPGVVVAAPLTSDEPGDTEALPVHLATLIAAKLGTGVTARPQAGTLAGARSIAGPSKTLIYVRASVAMGAVHVAADVYSEAANVWDRVRNPAPALIRQAAATAKIDAQARARLTPLALNRAQVQRFRLDEADVLAAACGDVDGDGRDELLLVSRQRVLLGHLEDGAFSAQKAVAWSELARRAPVPLREPLGGAVAEEGSILVGSTDYGGLALSTDLAKQDQLAGIPVWGGRPNSCLVAQPSAGAFDGAPVDCAPSRDPKPTMAVPAPRFDAFATADIVNANGDVRRLVAVREPSGRLKVRWGDESSGVLGLFGAALAVGDLDQDGFPEVVTTTGDGDAIDVLTLATAGAPPETRIHLSTPEPVRALTLCPPRDHGAPALVAVVGSEVWLVRPDLAGAAKSSSR